MLKKYNEIEGNVLRAATLLTVACWLLLSLGKNT